MIDFDFANKYRPQTFDDVIGNTATVTAVKTVLSRASGIPHAWLLHGPSGCGKTTLARIIASTLGCSKHDYREYDIGSEGGVDTIRALQETIIFAPKAGDCKVYVLDEVHALSARGQSALLKDLEEPPAHVYFILCTTNPEKLVNTIRSRCQAATFTVEMPRRNDVNKLLDRTCVAEGADPLPQNLKDAIYQQGVGCRDILGILDKIIDVPDDDEALQLISSVATVEAQVGQLCALMVGNPTLQTVLPILKALKKQNEDPEGIRRAILAWLVNAALRNNNPKRCEIVIELFSRNYFDVGFAGLVRDCVAVCD